MIEINHSCRAFLNNKGQVVIRVRWNNRKDEVGFSVGCNADPDKWDKENQRARYLSIALPRLSNRLPELLSIRFRRLSTSKRCLKEKNAVNFVFILMRKQNKK